ncbi:hypothetical protein N9L68_07760 [bacterium]|nr:hypothetical protein [bacterium]
MERKRAYNAEYRKRKSQNIEGHNTLMQAWEKARAPSDSAVLPPRSVLQGVALASPDSTESQFEDTEDPWELQRLHDAWLATEFFYKKKNYVYGSNECLDGEQLLSDYNMSEHDGKKECQDCRKLFSCAKMKRHRHLYCKTPQPVALDSARQGRPAEKGAVLEPPPPPEAPLEVAGSSDRRAASRSRSPRAPRGVLTGILLDALYAAQQEFAEDFVEATSGIRDGFYVSRGRLLRRAEQIMEAWMENKEARRSWRTRRRGRTTFG